MCVRQGSTLHYWAQVWGTGQQFRNKRWAIRLKQESEEYTWWGCRVVFLDFVETSKNVGLLFEVTEIARILITVDDDDDDDDDDAKFSICVFCI